MSELDTDHNSDFFAQAKPSNIYHVMERFNIPRPIKLDNPTNAAIANALVSEYSRTQVLDNQAILHLVNSSRGSSAFRPIAYYILHAKGRNFSQNQIDLLLKQVAFSDKREMIERFLNEDPVITALSPQHRETLKNASTTTIDKAISSIPISTQRHMLTFLSESSKDHVVDFLSDGEKGNALAFFSQAQKDWLLAELFAEKNATKDKPANPYVMLKSLKKYSPEAREYNLRQFPSYMLDEAIRHSWEQQFSAKQIPKIVMLFSDQSEEKIEQYAKYIEAAFDRGEKQIKQTKESASIYEGMVALNVDSKTGFTSLMPGAQSTFLLPLPTIPMPDGKEINPRLVIVNKTSLTDIGDLDNKLLNRTNAAGKLELDSNPTDIYNGMHQLCHALKLRHDDDMFFSPQQLENVRKMEKEPVQGFIIQPSLSPSHVAAAPAITTSQQKRAA